MILLETPTKARFIGYEDKLGELKKHLTYHDKKVDFEIKKWKHSPVSYKDPEAWKERNDQLKTERFKCILFEDDRGYWTYSGVAGFIARKFRDQVESKIDYPESANIPYSTIPSKKPRPFQVQMEDALQEVQHGGVEVGTGLGKSFSILRMVKHYGLPAVIMTPSVNIAKQIHEEFEKAFGKKYVGRFDGKKKDFKKKFVVAVSNSLANVQEGSDEWEWFQKAKVFIADESHMCPAQTLAKVCFGLMEKAPYRFFFSGTQMRNDGLDLLLDAITGPIVFRMTVKEGVDQGYLARPMFRTVKVRSNSQAQSPDANKMTRLHLYYNDEVNRNAAAIANFMVSELGRPTVILVEELKQFTKLLPYLKHKVAFAHGGVSKDNKDDILEQYWDSDPKVLVEQFNRGELPILVGTSCITTGTDIQAVQAILYLQGGKSEIQVKQAVGRGTRKPEGKTDCYFIDFDVWNIDITHRHAEARKVLYSEIYPDFAEMKL